MVVFGVPRYDFPRFPPRDWFLPFARTIDRRKTLALAAYHLLLSVPSYSDMAGFCGRTDRYRVIFFVSLRYL